MLTLRIQAFFVSLTWILAFGKGHDGKKFGFESFEWRDTSQRSVDNYSTVGWNSFHPTNMSENFEEGVFPFVENRDTIVLPGVQEGFKILHLPTKSGAELWGGFSKDKVFFGYDPHFSGPSRIRVILHDKIEEEWNEGGFVCDVADADADAKGLIYVRNLKFSCPTFQLCGAEVVVPCVMNVQICAFAAICFVFDSLEEFDNMNKVLREEGRRPIPKGYFAVSEKAGYMAGFMGIVVRAERKVNDQTGNPFYWALVETLNGHQIDVVIHPQTLMGRKNLRPGSIIHGFFFLSGRLMPGPEHTF